MKIRAGFVSNSSSSSFVCDVSGYEASGMDLCMSDIDMVRCDNDHYFLEEYLVGDRKEALKTFVKKQVEKYPEVADDWDLTDEDDIADFAYEWEFHYYTPPELCPICQFTTIVKRDVLAILLKDLEVSKEELAELYKERFGTYEKLADYLKG